MVENYIIEDTKGLMHDIEQIEEWSNKIEELGLEGQKKLVAEEGKSPIPFVHMNKSMKVMYETLCPRIYNYKDYDKTPIPLEVLALIGLCRKEGYFQELKIWVDDKEPDPLLIGITYPADKTWDKNFYCIARWGDELRSLVELKNKALERLKVEFEIKLNEARQKLAVMDPLALAKKKLGGDFASVTSDLGDLPF